MYLQQSTPIFIFPQKLKMKTNTSIFFTFFVLSSTLILQSTTAISSNDLLGVAPEDEKYYKGLWSSGTIKCKDGSKMFTKSQLNDDFCDCFDGTDEPGTSACPTGKFYCKNAGHSPLTIFSSRINDGICDCCDGSDEYGGKTRCNNTCWEAGKVARDKLMEKIALFQEGVTIRKQEIEQAKISVAKDEAELSKLKIEEKILRGIVQQLKEHKEQIEKAVEKERIQKEKEEKQKKEAEQSELKEHEGQEKIDVEEQVPVKNNDDRAAILDTNPSSKEDPVERAVDVVHTAHAPLDNGEKHDLKDEEVSEVVHGSEPNNELGNKVEDATKGIDSLSREDLGREIGSRWTGKKTDQQNYDVDGAKKDYETSVDVHDEENNGYDTESDDPDNYDDDCKVDDVEDENNDVSSSSYNYDPDDDDMNILDMETESSPSWFEKVQRTVRNVLQTVNPFQTPVNISEAENVQKEYNEASTKLSKLKSRILRLTKKLENDFGPEKEFYSLYGQCFESKQNKYVYKVCPFKQATQEEGYSTTRLGKWEKFEESYNVMLFSNGDNCWNGPDRSLKVRLRCGLKLEVADVGEPSRCEYAAMLTTPALCLEGKLKELEDELEMLYKQPQFHDEL